jgi:hypothetical protein
MSESLQTVISEDRREKFLLAVAFPSSRSASLIEAAMEAGISTADAVRLMNDPGFIAQVRQVTFAQASAALHGEGIADLIRIATRSETDREKLTAWRTIAMLTGDLKHKHQHDVRVTFEDMRDRRGGDELAGLFDIRGAVVEAELEDAG